MKATDVDAMVAAYVECLLWAGLDWDDMEGDNPRPLDENYGPEDLAPEALASITAECEAFYRDNAGDLASWDAEQAGHDFYLTRNGHGAGFWDRGKGAEGDRLAAAARAYGESGEYVEGGKVHVDR